MLKSVDTARTSVKSLSAARLLQITRRTRLRFFNLIMEVKDLENIFVIILWISWYISLAHGECKQCVTLGINVKSNYTVANHSLVGSSLSILRVKWFGECFTACIEKDCRCTSFNMEDKKTGTDDLECVLNYHTRHSKPDRFVQKPGYTYYQITASKSKVSPGRPKE